MPTLTSLRTLALALIAALALAAPALAQTFPPLTGRVVDEAQVLSPGARAALTQKLAAFEARTSAQVVVATVKSLQGLAVEDYANRLFRQWRLGQKDKNNGVLLLFAPAERKVRIEVGYGLEGWLPDAVAKLIVFEQVNALFRAKQFDSVVAMGVDAIIDALDGKGRAGLARPQPAAPHVIELPPVANILAVGLLGGLFLVFFVCMASLLFGSLIRGLIAIHLLPKGADRRGIIGKLIWFEPSKSPSRDAEPAFASSSPSDRFSGGGGSSGGAGASGSW